MALTEKFKYQIEVNNREDVHVRRERIIYDDGEEVSTSYDRWVLHPGDNYAPAPTRVQRVCAVVHTPEAIALRAAFVDLQDKKAVLEEKIAATATAQAAYDADPTQENLDALNAAIAEQATAQSEKDTAKATYDAAMAAYEADIA